MNQELVRSLLDGALVENTSLFLIELAFLSDNKIKVIVDGDKGVPLSECMRISRAIEHNLDREEFDFSLEVTTPDLSHPLINKRQFNKNLGRTLKIKLTGEDVEGELIDISEEGVTLKWKVREPKPIGKGKHTVEKTRTFLFSEIIEAKVKIIF